MSPSPRDAIANARRLRREQTEPERRLWHMLRNGLLGAKFRRQHPEPPYTLDFVCLARMLVVEVDGETHADGAHDRRRDAWLRRRGFRVLRFWNHEVLHNLEGVGLEIVRHLAEPSPACRHPLPGGEGN